VIDLDILLGFRTQREAQNFCKVTERATLATVPGAVHVTLRAPRGSLLDPAALFYEPEVHQGLPWRVRVRTAPCTHPRTYPTDRGERRCTICGECGERDPHPPTF
jgi:hypothetical protein